MGAGNGLFHGNAGLDFAVKVADLSRDLGQASCGMAFGDGKRLGLEPVQRGYDLRSGPPLRPASL